MSKKKGFLAAILCVRPYQNRVQLAWANSVPTRVCRVLDCKTGTPAGEGTPSIWKTTPSQAYCDTMAATQAFRGTSFGNNALMPGCTQFCVFLATGSTFPLLGIAA